MPMCLFQPGVTKDETLWLGQALLCDRREYSPIWPAFTLKGISNSLWNTNTSKLLQLQTSKKLKDKWIMCEADMLCLHSDLRGFCMFIYVSGSNQNRNQRSVQIRIGSGFNRTVSTTSLSSESRSDARPEGEPDLHTTLQYQVWPGSLRGLVHRLTTSGT